MPQICNLRPLNKQRPQPAPQQTGASSERFSSFGLGPGEYKNNFGNQQPNFRPVKFPKFPNFGKTPKFKSIKFPKIPSNILHNSNLLLNILDSKNSFGER